MFCYLSVFGYIEMVFVVFLDITRQSTDARHPGYFRTIIGFVITGYIS